MNNGNFVISLDFEIYWGVRDIMLLEEYKDNLTGVRKVIPSLVDLFNKYNIKATFATVGLLFFHDKKEMLQGLPQLQPTYENENLSPYSTLNSVGENETDDIYHYAPSLIDMIIKTGHEIGSHTFSHYYCLEKGQTISQFSEDLKAAKRIAENRGITLQSIVFPRHQFNNDHLKICKEQGITCYRGNQLSWIHKPIIGIEKAWFRKTIRIIDTYINLLGYDTYSIEYMKKYCPLNIPASRFLRPYSKKIRLLDKFRLRRILSSMTYAAKYNRTYHLWWHPHNFGVNLEENLNFLEKILRHYQKLEILHGFQSLSMYKLAEKLLREDK